MKNSVLPRRFGLRSVFRRLRTRANPPSARKLAVVLLVTQVFFSSGVALWATGQVEGYAAARLPSRTTEKVRIDRRLPPVTSVPEFPVFSGSPTDEEVARVLVGPILKMDDISWNVGAGVLGGSALFSAIDRSFTHPDQPSIKENRALAQALLACANSGSAQDVSPVEEFLKQFPRSSWRASLVINLGVVYRQTGYFTKALRAFEEAWKLTRNGDGKNTQALANWAVGELASMYGHLGHAQRLEELFADIGQRDLHGPTTERVANARESLRSWRRWPEESFRCGPMALASLLAHEHVSRPYDPKLINARTTAHGMSLARVAELANEFNVRLQIAWRQPGAKILIPAVVHWKVEHFSALVDLREEGGKEWCLVENPLFENRIWVSREALDEETSGYYLVSQGDLPVGWRPVSEAEGENVWGRCYTAKGDDQQTMCYAEKVKCDCGAFRGIPQYDFHAMLVSLNIVDQPLGYAPPRGPSVHFTITYNQREAYQPAVFSFSNLGPKWTFDWLSYVADGGGSGSRVVTVYLRGGGQETYQLRGGIVGFPAFYNINTQSHTELALVSPDRQGVIYERRFPDGSKEIFSQPDGSRVSRRVFLTEIVDPAGSAVKLTYDSNMRVVAVTDALAQVTTLSYEMPGDPLKITKVTDPFGRSATFWYDVQGHLTRVTDVINLTSEFTYDTKDFISVMRTPYGTTRFRTGVESFNNDDTTRWVEATDPVGDTERLEFRHRAPGLPVNDQEDLYYRNSFYWDKRAWKEAPGDYLKAKRFHWLALIGSVTSGILQDEQRPLESRVRYRYLGQSVITFAGSNGLPSEIARALDGGATQSLRFQYNERGHVTESVDPAGRRFLRFYDANQIDLVEVRNGGTGETLAKFTYSGLHVPLSYTDAAGQTTTFGYNAQGQMTTSINARGEKTSFTYDEHGYLIKITGALEGATVGFAYDEFGRLHSVTDSEGYRVVVEYDALDRPTKITYPDQTFEQLTYDRMDLVQIRDRLTRITQVDYDTLRRPTSVTDPMEKVTRFVWCNCGGLSQMIDPAGNITTWNRDLQGRVTSKLLADGTETRFVYEKTTSRLKQMIDARGQATKYDYAVDDSLALISFDDAVIPTPGVMFFYDPNYNRLVRFQDGTGTTIFRYHPAGMLGALQVAAVDGPLDNDTIAYVYD